MQNVALMYHARALRRRWLVVVASIGLALAAAAVFTARATPLYASTITMYVSSPLSNDPALAYQGELLSQQRVLSFADVVGSQRVTRRVASEIGAGLTSASLQKEISTQVVQGTVLLRATVTDPSPQRAYDIARDLAKTFAALVSSLEQPRNRAGSPVKVTVVDGAQLPTAPVSPRRILNLALGLLIGLAVGVTAGLLRDRLDTSIMSHEVLEEATGHAVLGAIGFDRGARARPLIVQWTGGSPRAEAFRSMRTNLQFVDVDRPPRSVVVTSCVPGEGKSTTACNLAVAIAQAGSRVILVEADLRRPSVAGYLGIEGAAGLTSVLIGRARLEEVIQPWGPDGLSVVASGPIPPNPSELLGSRNMRGVLQHLGELADIVIFDSPPLLSVADAAILARICDGSLLVVKYGKTRREAVARAVERLETVNARLLGSILNFAPAKQLDGYGYGYGYGYEPQAAPAVIRARHVSPPVQRQEAGSGSRAPSRR